MTYPIIPTYNNLTTMKDVREKSLNPLITQHNEHSLHLQNLDIEKVEQESYDGLVNGLINGTQSVNTKSLGHKNIVYESSITKLQTTTFMKLDSGTATATLPEIVPFDTLTITDSQCKEGATFIIANLSTVKFGAVRASASQKLVVTQDLAEADSYTLTFLRCVEFVAMRKSDNTFYWIMKSDDSFLEKAPSLTDAATKVYVNEAIENLRSLILGGEVNDTLDTFLELQQKLENDDEITAQIIASLAEKVSQETFDNFTASNDLFLENKVDKVDGKQLSQEDFTTEHKTQLESLNVTAAKLNEESKKLTQFHTLELPIVGVGYFNYLNNADARAQGMQPNQAGDGAENSVIFDDLVNENVYEVKDTRSSLRSDECLLIPTALAVQARTNGDGTIKIEFDVRTMLFEDNSATSPCSLWYCLSEATCRALAAQNVGLGSITRGGARLQLQLLANNYFVRAFSSDLEYVDYPITLGGYDIIAMHIKLDNTYDVLVNNTVIANAPVHQYQNTAYEDRIFIGSGSSNARHQCQRFRSIKFISNGANKDYVLSKEHFDKNNTFDVHGAGNVRITLPADCTKYSSVNIEARSQGDVTIITPDLTQKTYSLTNEDPLKLHVRSNNEDQFSIFKLTQ